MRGKVLLKLATLYPGPVSGTAGFNPLAGKSFVETGLPTIGKPARLVSIPLRGKVLLKLIPPPTPETTRYFVSIPLRGKVLLKHQAQHEERLYKFGFNPLAGKSFVETLIIPVQVSVGGDVSIPLRGKVLLKPSIPYMLSMNLEVSIPLRGKVLLKLSR